MDTVTSEALRAWLLNDAAKLEIGAMVEALAYRLDAAGVPLDRMTVSFGLLNPSILAAGVIWRREVGIAFTRYDYDRRDEGIYDRSPLKRAHDSGRWIDIDVRAASASDYGIIPDLKADGLAHYVAIPMPDSSGRIMSLTLATADPAGFNAGHRALVADLLPALASVVEIKTLRAMLRDVVSAYVGKEPARQIIEGTVHRGEVTQVRAAILIADLRGFTHLSTRLPPEATADVINLYYDIVVPPIEANGGEILKFIGDAVLAIFPTERLGDTAAVLSALEAARSALATPIEPFEVNGTTVSVRFGVGIHLGDAVFGNVGSGNRLDFTVIGRDVNVTARIASLCSRLDYPFLVSEPVASIGRANGTAMCDAGAHEVRGLEDPLHVYIPDKDTAPRTNDDGVSQGLVLLD